MSPVVSSSRAIFGRTTGLGTFRFAFGARFRLGSGATGAFSGELQKVLVVPPTVLLLLVDEEVVVDGGGLRVRGLNSKVSPVEPRLSLTVWCVLTRSIVISPVSWFTMIKHCFPAQLSLFPEENLSKS